MEKSLEDGLTDVRDFQGLLATRPKQVIKWLQENGMEKLGEFEVQVCVATQADMLKHVHSEKTQAHHATHASGGERVTHMRHTQR